MAPGRATLLLLACLAAPLAAAAARTRLLGEADAELAPVPPEFIATNDTLSSLLERTAAPNRAVIFTTTRLPRGDPREVMEMLSNFCYFLDRAGLLGYTLILTTDEPTWHQLAAKGFPVILDHVLPEREEYRNGGQPGDTPNRVFDVQKHYWGATIIARGYRVLYMDSDALVLQDPLRHFNPAYDVQSVADWSGPEMPRVGDTLTASCGLYKWIPDPRPPTGAVLREFWHYGPGDAERSLHSQNPCASTGIWYLEPSPMAVRFMGAMRDRLLDPGTRFQWDQTAWNEVIVPFLWGVGDEPPLRYRLLPIRSFFAAVGNYEARMREGLQVDPVILHPAGLHGHQKAEAFQRLGFWHPDFSLPTRPTPGIGGSLAVQSQLANASSGTGAGPAGVQAAGIKAAPQDAAQPGAGLQRTEAAAGEPGALGALAHAPVTHPGLAAAAVFFAVAGLAGCTFGLVQWRRARAAAAGQPHRVIKLLPTPRVSGSGTP